MGEGSAKRRISDEETDPQGTEPAGRERIGRYQLCFELATGGMATVYLARADGPAGFEKLVALKRIHRHLAKDPQYINMFLDEARIASRITHANVCSVFDFGEADGEYFIAMEYLLGEPLSRVGRAIARSTEQRASERLSTVVSRIAADAAEGLHAAHELKDADGSLLEVVHRDVSPQNLFVSYDGSVRVVDFGIASAKHRMHKTVTGEVKGKFAYMAPEQLEIGDLDRRVDVWALGVVLWELLTLQRLFRRQTDMATMRAITMDEIKPPSAVRESVPKELDEIVMKALSRDREGRHATARELSTDLVRFLGKQGDPVGLADIAGWMEQLFPEGQVKKRQLMREARITRSGVPSVPPDDSQTFATHTASAIKIRQTEVRRRRWLPWVAIALGVAAGAAFFIANRAPDVAAGESEPSIGAEPATTESAVEPVTNTPEAAPDAAVVAAEPTAPETPPEPAEPPAAEVAKSESSKSTRRPRRRSRKTKASSKTEAAPTPRQAEKAPAATPAKGTLVVVTPGGWGNVYDSSGRFLGPTPLRVQLPAGTHRLQLRPFGQPPPVPLTAVVKGGQKVTVKKRLSE